MKGGIWRLREEFGDKGRDLEKIKGGLRKGLGQTSIQNRTILREHVNKLAN